MQQIIMRNTLVIHYQGVCHIYYQMWNIYSHVCLSRNNAVKKYITYTNTYMLHSKVKYTVFKIPIIEELFV